MRYLFWNTNKRDVDEVICSMVKEYNPTVLALAEYEKDIENLVNSIKAYADKNYIAIDKFACRIQILIHEKLSDNVEHCADHTNYSIKKLLYNSYNEKHIVAFIHLPSKMYDNK